MKNQISYKLAVASLPNDDFDRMEDYYESQADYSEDNPQDYGDEDEFF